MPAPSCEALVEAIHAAPHRAVVAVTGGGSGAIERLLSVPGASRTVLEAVVPYAGSALAEWVGGEPTQACSEATARRMAMAAFQRARRLADSETDPHRLIGLGCTAALATDRVKKGEHRIHIATQTAERTFAIELRLEKGRRTRAEEEAVATHAVVTALGNAAGVREIDLTKTPPGIEASTRSAEAVGDLSELLLGRARSVAINGAEQTPRLLLPGSFNPMHTGHAEMMEIAEARLGVSGVFELSMTNVDKPPLDYLDIESRLTALGDRPTLVTDAPRFVEKAELAPGAVFAVGADTAVRIGDAAYYGDDFSRCDAALDRLAELGVRFLVFGRQIDTRFRDLEELALPPRLASLCEGVIEADFRRDISSSDIRAGVGGDAASPPG